MCFSRVYTYVVTIRGNPSNRNCVIMACRPNGIPRRFQMSLKVRSHYLDWIRIPPNRGGLRKDSDWTRSNVNAIRLNSYWRWAGCYGEIAVRCLFYKFCPKYWTLTSHFTQSPELDQSNVNASGKSDTSPVSVQIQCKLASVNAP